MQARRARGIPTEGLDVHAWAHRNRVSA
jgi:hypothetical protein